jgi:hypothetical protein
MESLYQMFISNWGKPIDSTKSADLIAAIKRTLLNYHPMH